MNQNQPVLDGLEQPRPAATALELAAHRQLSALYDAGLLTASNAITVQLVKDLASVVGQSCADGKAAAAALASKQLMEALASLPAAVEENGLAALSAQLRAVS